jgi:hypothetical protein
VYVRRVREGLDEEHRLVETVAQAVLNALHPENPSSHFPISSSKRGKKPAQVLW